MAELNVLGEEINNLTLSNVRISDVHKPRFLNGKSDYEYITWSIVKRNYTGTLYDATQQSSSEVYGTTSDFKVLAEQNDVLYFDDYLNLPNGILGDCALNNFSQNYGIVHGNFHNHLLTGTGQTMLT